MKIMTFNLKNDTFFTSKHMRWEVRKQYVLNIIRLYSPDIIGVQELTPETKQQLEELLPEYRFVGQPRNRSWQIMNEQTDIGFKKERFLCLEGDTFWLSSSPNKQGSRVWTSIFPRICTRALLQDKTTNQQILVYNTHLDHLIPHSRLKEMMILTKAIQERKLNHVPVVLMGDFNTNAHSKALKLLSENSMRYKSVYASSFVIHNTIHHGSGKTNENAQPIDYIFVSEEVEVTDCEIITTHFNGLYPSDHYPVICNLKLDAK